MNSTQDVSAAIHCYHCGDECRNGRINIEDKLFCCEGCRMVYEILNENELCQYYSLNENPGINQRFQVREDKFSFLSDEKVVARLARFSDEKETHVNFYLPQIHCSSCLWLLEHLHKLDAGIVSSVVNFARKEVDIVFLNKQVTLREVAELLTRIGYEPYISLNDLEAARPAIDKTMIYQLGVAGFCFGNIMLMSFPEYFGIDPTETGLRTIFRWLNLALSLPVFFYSAQPFYISAWKSLRHKFLNIDAPIALAIIITFIRSLYEVLSGTGGGYFDSMTGIVFFMLAGRILQDKTYRQLSFDRDYQSYFPVAVSLIKDGVEAPVMLPDISPGDTLLIHNEEIIPADGILTKGTAFIDYSFVTGESLPVLKEIGEIVYAGGKQTGGNIEILVVKEVSQSYLTKLWNRIEDKPGVKAVHHSFVHLLSRYFTYIVLAIAASTAIYWGFRDDTKIWPAVTAIFIIACPCALLLSNTFTNGNVLRILGRNRFYLRNAEAIEDIARINHIVFDKTGTLTTPHESEIVYAGTPLTNSQIEQVGALAACSGHPLSKSLASHLGIRSNQPIHQFTEVTGHGISGIINEDMIKMGSLSFVTGNESKESKTAVHVAIGNDYPGTFYFSNQYRKDIATLASAFKHRYRVSVLSGDNDAEKKRLMALFGSEAALLFNQSPSDKLSYIRKLQEQGARVMMIGDGLNDAGALRQSDMGIAVTQHTNNFTPASQGIIEASRLTLLDRFIRLCKANRRIVLASFILSILYNLIGLYFAVQGDLSPLIAAILMPSSSLSIVLLTFGASNIYAHSLKLK